MEIINTQECRAAAVPQGGVFRCPDRHLWYVARWETGESGIWCVRLDAGPNDDLCADFFSADVMVEHFPKAVLVLTGKGGNPETYKTKGPSDGQV